MGTAESNDGNCLKKYLKTRVDSCADYAREIFSMHWHSGTGAIIAFRMMAAISSYRDMYIISHPG